MKTTIIITLASIITVANIVLFVAKQGEAPITRKCPDAEIVIIPKGTTTIPLGLNWTPINER